MGLVYRARDPLLDRHVAVKVLFPSSSLGAGDLLEEARALAALAHPNIVSVFEVGVHDEQAFMAMELLVGTTLRALMRSSRVSMRRALGLASQMARGLAAAHASAIVHCDVKPDNVIVTDAGPVKLIDFGLARSTLARLSEARVERAGGTPGYLAPEIEQGSRPTPASDVYALGIVLRQFMDSFAGRPAVEQQPGRVLRDLVETACAPHPMARPTADVMATRLGELVGALDRPEPGSAAPRLWVVPPELPPAPTGEAVSGVQTQTISRGLPPPVIVSSCGRVQGWLLDPIGMLNIVAPGAVVDGAVAGFIMEQLDKRMRLRSPRGPYRFIHDFSQSHSYTSEARQLLTCYGTRVLGETSRAILAVPHARPLYQMGAMTAVAVLRASGMRIDLASDWRAGLAELGCAVVG